MAWEPRHGHEYLYRSYRDATGQVRRQYLGRGSAAAVAAAEMEHARKQADAASKTLAQLEADEARHQAIVQEFDAGIDTLLEAELRCRGCYCHAGTWRKRRETRT